MKEKTFQKVYLENKSNLRFLAATRGRFYSTLFAQCSPRGCDRHCTHVFGRDSNPRAPVEFHLVSLFITGPQKTLSINSWMKLPSCKGKKSSIQHFHQTQIQFAAYKNVIQTFVLKPKPKVLFFLFYFCKLTTALPESSACLPARLTVLFVCLMFVVIPPFVD